MTKTALQLINRARFYINDTRGSSDLFSDHDRPDESGLLSILEDALIEVQDHIISGFQGFYLKNVKLDLVENEDTIKLPDDFLTLSFLERVKDSGGNTLRVPVTLNPLEKLEHKNWIVGKHMPEYYKIIGCDLLIVPTSLSTISEALSLWYYRQIKIPEKVEDEVDVPKDYYEVISISTAIRALIAYSVRMKLTPDQLPLAPLIQHKHYLIEQLRTKKRNTQVPRFIQASSDDTDHRHYRYIVPYY